MYIHKVTGRTMSDEEYVKMTVREVFDSEFKDGFTIDQYDEFLWQVKRYMEADQDFKYEYDNNEIDE